MAEGVLRIRVLGDIAQFQNEMQKLGSSLDKTGAQLQNAGRNLTVMTAPLAALGAGAVKLGLDFDTSLRQIVGLTDVTQEQIGGIREEILKLGPAVGKTPQELADAFYFIASAGFDAGEAMDVLETAAKASAAGLGDTQDIAKNLGLVINAYGKENIDAARAADILTEAVSQGTAEASDFSGVLGRVVPTAASLKVPFEDVSAALAGMTLTGLSAEESAVSLNQVLVSLLKPTKEAEDALEGMGTSSAELRQELREKGLLETLRDLEERFGDNEQAASLVFGNVRALRGVTSLLTLDSSQLNDVFGKVTDSLGRMQKGYADTEGPQRELDRALAEGQAALIELGEDVIPVFVDVLHEAVGAIKDVTKWWKGLDDGTKETIVKFGALAVAAGPVLFAFGSLSRGIGSILNLIGGTAGLVRKTIEMTAAIWADTAATEANTTAKVANKASLLGLVAPLVIIAGLAEAAREALDFRGERQQIISDHDLSNAEALAIQLSKMTESQRQYALAHGAANEFLREGTTYAEALAAAEQKIGAAATDVATNIEPAINEFTGFVTNMRTAATAGGTDTGEAFVDSTVEATVAGLRDNSDIVSGALKSQIQRAGNAAANAAGDVGDAIVDNLAAALRDEDPVKSAMKDLTWAINHPLALQKELARIEGKLTGHKLAEGLASENPFIRQQAEQTRDQLLQRWESLTGEAYDTGKEGGEEFGKGAKKGVDNKADSVVDAARTWILNKLANLPWERGGDNAGDAWVGAFGKSMWGAPAVVQGVLNKIRRQLVGNSPPPEGPLKDIDKGGWNVGRAWREALDRAMGGSIANPFGSLTPAFAFAGGGSVAPRGGVTINGGITVNVTGGQTNAETGDSVKQGVLDALSEIVDSYQPGMARYTRSTR